MNPFWDFRFIGFRKKNMTTRFSGTFRKMYPGENGLMRLCGRIHSTSLTVVRLGSGVVLRGIILFSLFEFCKINGIWRKYEYSIPPFGLVYQWNRLKLFNTITVLKKMKNAVCFYSFKKWKLFLYLWQASRLDSLVLCVLRMSTLQHPHQMSSLNPFKGDQYDRWLSVRAGDIELCR